MEDDPSKKDLKGKGPKVIVTHKPKSTVSPHGFPEEITPKLTREVVQNPIESGVNPAKFIKSEDALHHSSDDILDKIKPRHSSNAKEDSISAPSTPEKTIEIHHTSGSAWLAMSLSFLSLIAAGGFGFLAFTGYQKTLNLSDILQKQESEQQLLAKSIESKFATLSSVKTEQEKQLKDFEFLKKDVRNTQVNMLRISGDSQWLLAEANYLVNLASERLVANKDILTARRQLQSALEKVTQIGGLQLQSVKRVLEDDLHELNSVKIVDSQVIWQQLSDMTHHLLKLKMSNLTSELSVDETPKELKTGWREALKASYNEIKDLIRVTKYEQESFAPILDASEQDQLLQVMTLMIEQAKWAVLNQNQNIYQNSLNQLSSFLEKFFIQDSQAQGILTSIDTLKAQNVSVEAPDISRSKFALSQALSNIGNKRDSVLESQEYGP